MFTFAIQIYNFIYRGRFGLNFNLDQAKNTVTDRAFGVLNLFIYNSNKFTYKFDIQSSRTFRQEEKNPLRNREYHQYEG